MPGHYLKKILMRNRLRLNTNLPYIKVSVETKHDNLADLRKRLWFDAARWFATLPVDAAIGRLMERLGNLHNADRVWLAMLYSDDTRARVTHEWDADGVSPTMGRQNDQLVDTYRWIYNKLSKGKEVLFALSDIPDRFAHFRNHLAMQGAQTFYGVPIFVTGRHVGVLGYHKVTTARKWNSAERKEVRLAAGLLGEWLATKPSRQPAEKPPEKGDGAIFVRSEGETIAVKFSKIIYIEAALNYSQIYMTESKPLVIYRSMEEWEKTLPEEQFLRVQRSYIINLSKITKLSKNAGAWILHLANRHAISVGRMFRPRLVKKMQLLQHK